MFNAYDREPGEVHLIHKHEGGNITFEDGGKTAIEGKGTVKLNTCLTLNDVSCAKSLGFNLLRIKKLYGNRKNKVTFRTEGVVVKKLKTK